MLYWDIINYLIKSMQILLSFQNMKWKTASNEFNEIINVKLNKLFYSYYYRVLRTSGNVWCHVCIMYILHRSLPSSGNTGAIFISQQNRLNWCNNYPLITFVFPRTFLFVLLYNLFYIYREKYRIFYDIINFILILRFEYF